MMEKDTLIRLPYFFPFFSFTFPHPLEDDDIDDQAVTRHSYEGGAHVKEYEEYFQGTWENIKRVDVTIKPLIESNVKVASCSLHDYWLSMI